MVEVAREYRARYKSVGRRVGRASVAPRLEARPPMETRQGRGLGRLPARCRARKGRGGGTRQDNLDGRERRGEAFVGVSRAVLGGGRGTSGVNPAARSSAREYVVGENR